MKLLFDPSNCVMAIAITEEGTTKYHLYSPEYFNYCAAIFTAEDKINPDEALDTVGYCGIIATKIMNSELFNPELLMTAEELSDVFTTVYALNMYGCSLNQLYAAITESVRVLSEKLEQLKATDSPTIH